MSTKDAKAREDLTEALAILISNTRTHKRPLPLPAVAQALTTAIAQLGSYSAVADRIGISTKMLRQFGYIHRLAPDVQRLFRERRLDSVDAAVHLSMLSGRDQSLLAAELVSGAIDSADLRAVCELRRLGTREPIRKLIARVKGSKTRREYIVEFVVRGGRGEREIRAAIANHIPTREIIRIEVHGALGRLALTKKGKAFLSRAAKALNTRLSDTIPQILRPQLTRAQGRSRR